MNPLFGIFLEAKFKSNPEFFPQVFFISTVVLELEFFLNGSEIVSKG